MKVAKLYKWEVSQTSKGQFSSTTYWTNVVIKGSSEIVCKVPGNSKQASIKAATYIAALHNGEIEYHSNQ